MSVPVHRRMLPRDPDQDHRASTPLELFFDLAMVVAVSTAAAQLHHAVSEGHLAHGLGGYLTVFFGIWWAWVNFTWFSSAFDTDDLLMRLLTMVQMAGVLVLAAGVPRAFRLEDFTVVVAGYVVMRVALLTQWIRAEHESGDPEGVCRRYWTAIALVQLFWVARLWTHGTLGTVTLLLGFLLELLVPAYAERGTSGSPWHPTHIAERYGLFVIIVCGEVILSATGSFNAALESGLTSQVVLVGIGAVLIVFTLWSVYFQREHGEEITRRNVWGWAYLHYAVFASVAAVGAGIGVMVDLAQHDAHLSYVGGDLILSGSIAVYLIALAVSSYLLNHHLNELVIGVLVAVLVLAVGILGQAPGTTTLLIGLVLLTTLVINVFVAARLYPDDGAADHAVAP